MPGALDYRNYRQAHQLVIIYLVVYIYKGVTGDFLGGDEPIIPPLFPLKGQTTALFDISFPMFCFLAVSPKQDEINLKRRIGTT